MVGRVVGGGVSAFRQRGETEKELPLHGLDDDDDDDDAADDDLL